MKETKEGAVFITEGNTLVEGWIDMKGDGDSVMIDEDRYRYLGKPCHCFIKDVLVEHPYEFRYPQEFKSHLLFSNS